ncbi:MAG: trimethylamine methyltransferase family protein [Candidatus Puniceispirillaceae bacterium]
MAILDKQESNPNGKIKMNEISPKNRRGAGRAARHMQRQTKGAIAHPCPPGQIGGMYRPLTEKGLTDIIDTAYRLLEEIGMGEVPAELQDMALAKGAYLNAHGRLCYSRAMIEDVIAKAPNQFMLYGRDPKHDIEIGGDKVYYGTGGAAVQTLDVDTGLYRASTLVDLYEFTRLADQMDNLSWFTRICVATDIPDIHELDINTVYALIAGTQKPVGTSFTFGETVAPSIAMFDAAMGGTGAFAKRPCCKVHISPIISPLKYGEDAFDVAKAAIDHNMVINAIIAAQSGATAPAPLAGMLAQTTAETLAALMMVNIIKPEHPMIFSNWPFVVDLRTGSFTGSGGEISVLNAAAAQISNALGLVSGVASSMADAKAVDAQMGMEKGLSSLAAGLAGANMIYESAGMMASLLGASFEAMILDNEMLALNQRAIRGVEVSEETLGFDAIKSAVYGDGHFLGGDQTMDAMLRDYFYPKLANRDNPTIWEETGAKDAWHVAKDTFRQLQSEPRETYLSQTADTSIRDRFTIHLSKDLMS